MWLGWWMFIKAIRGWPGTWMVGIEICIEKVSIRTALTILLSSSALTRQLFNFNFRFSLAQPYLDPWQLSTSPPGWRFSLLTKIEQTCSPWHLFSTTYNKLHLRIVQRRIWDILPDFSYPEALLDLAFRITKLDVCSPIHNRLEKNLQMWQILENWKI